MAITPTAIHPAWCDPHTCKSSLGNDGSVSYEHIEPAAVLRPSAHPDLEATVYRTRLDDISKFPSIAPVRTTLRLVDTSLLVGGKHAEIDLDLNPLDARLLAAQLVVVAEQVERGGNA